ncbi:MAG: oligosaccharide flippase family protein [Aureliella sp.]
MCGSIYLLLMHVGVEVLALGRNIVVARLLGSEEMGFATLLAVTLRMFEMASDWSTDRLLIQAPDGNRVGFQSTAHGIEVCRGGLISLLTVGAGAIMATLVASSPPLSAYVWLALIPLIRGFQHLDSKRLQRRLQFKMAAAVEFPAALVSVAVLWPLSALLDDYRLVIASSLFQSLVYVAVSHWLAKRSYRIAIRREFGIRFLRFGWPLAANGLLMFAALQGDRFLVAAWCTPSELARYAIALQLSLMPFLILSRIANSVLLPLLSRERQSPAVFRRLFIQAALSGIAIAGVVAVGEIAFELPTIQFAYGNEFLISSSLVLYFAVAHAIRFLRTIPTVTALADGDSRHPLQVNCIRTIGLFLAVVAASKGAGLTGIALAGVFGEVVSLLASMFLLHRRIAIFSVVADQSSALKSCQV